MPCLTAQRGRRLERGPKLLERFRGLFEGQRYPHRRSNIGDQVASYLYDDLFDLGRSPKSVAAVGGQQRVINLANVSVGRSARRGDGMFGDPSQMLRPSLCPNTWCRFGLVATVDFGIEVIVLAKVMIKQLDRIGTDMINQVSEFQRYGDNPICFGIVGINRTRSYVSFEGVREWPTNGRKIRTRIKKPTRLNGVFCRGLRSI